MAFPTIKGRALVAFPANVTAYAPLSLTKANGGYSFTMDWSTLANEAAPDPTTHKVILQDNTGSFITTTLDNLPVGIVPWAGITGKPTTVAGYGITDGVTTARTVSTSAPLAGGGALSGDLTLVLNANGITNSYLAQVATATFKGRTTASTGNVEDLTATQATALLNVAVGDSGSGGTKGLVPAAPAGSAASNHFLSADGTFKATPATALPMGHVSGLVLSNNVTDATNDIDVTAGKARSSLDAADLVLASAITKRLDAAWAVGSGNGGRMSAAAIADTTYHVFIIRRSDTGVVDVGFDVSATAPTMPTNYDSFRRIGSIIRASSTIVAFTEYGTGNERIFKLKAITGNFSVSSAGTSRVLRQMTIPSGVKYEAICHICLADAAGAGDYVLLTDPDQNDLAATSSFSSLQVEANGRDAGEFSIMTNTSGQIGTRFTTGGATSFLIGLTSGWRDFL